MRNEPGKRINFVIILFLLYLEDIYRLSIPNHAIHVGVDYIKSIKVVRERKYPSHSPCNHHHTENMFELSPVESYINLSFKLNLFK